MNKEILTIYQAHERRISFIEKAVGEGVLGKISANERNQGIALIYYLNEGISGEKIGKIFPKTSGEFLTRECVRQISKKVLDKIWKHASLKLQTDHPLYELFMKRLLPLEEPTLQVKFAVEKNMNPAKIRDMVLSPKQLNSMRKSLKKRGIAIPSIRPYASFAERVEKVKNNNRELKKLLYSFTEGSLLGYLNHHRKDEKKILVNLSSVLTEGRFCFEPKSLKLFAEKILKKNIPLRIIRSKKNNQAYYIAFAVNEQKNKIIKTLRDDPDLQRFKDNPFKLVCGNMDEKIPTIQTLKNKEKYGSLSVLANETISFRSTKKRGQNLSELMKNCTIPIFKARGKYYYPISKTEELQAFLKSKQEKI